MAESIKIISPRGEGVSGFVNSARIVAHHWKYRDLIRQSMWREVAGCCKGSFIGLGWSFIQPLIILCVYTFVFSVIFKARGDAFCSKYHGRIFSGGKLKCIKVRWITCWLSEKSIWKARKTSHYSYSIWEALT